MMLQELMQQTNQAMNTCFEYCYRDAGNFKAFGQVIFEGEIAAEQLEMVEEKMEAGEFFIAEQLRIPTLYHKLEAYSGGPTHNDHTWHSLSKISLIDQSPEVSTSEIWGPVEKFVQSILDIDDWNLELSKNYLLDY